MENRAVIEIPIEDLYNHPKNVRKRYTDIEDLTASIRESGIWQNLTVVPVPEEQDKYYVVIGNRRLQAARAAGLKSCPCIIAWNMTEQEQQTTMLLENMQRSDLTPVEEAEGMQMCLDLGLTPADLERKTGLSKTTVKRRLEIAKLDKDILMKQAAGTGTYQLSLSDFTNLEKVKDINARNEILNKASNSANLKYLIDREVEHQEKEKNAQKLREMFAKVGITKILTVKEKDSWGFIVWFPKATKPHGNEVIYI